MAPQPGPKHQHIWGDTDVPPIAVVPPPLILIIQGSCGARVLLLLLALLGLPDLTLSSHCPHAVQDPDSHGTCIGTGQEDWEEQLESNLRVNLAHGTRISLSLNSAHALSEVLKLSGITHVLHCPQEGVLRKTMVVMWGRVVGRPMG